MNEDQTFDLIRERIIRDVPHLRLKCLACNTPLVIKINHKTKRKFWACSNFPFCKVTMNYGQGVRIIQMEYHLKYVVPREDEKTKV